ncbi:hypothetical protein OQJ18_09330 [Fluoribacter dumoffii]|uniref:hypothetical protein n=1 Tax=Fluoribacter dumoffii TaxID=463 RepID=UPI00026C7AB8|nr:hypothetical protein [Fluoribacter dumoffii]MCW8417700.1 hypothetical protein [Fluoribacter dumoffii]MCW8454458.1 hypothetical protein [Fluoribacter dumoffii]MCW8461468.1 hypothetical protein [Fluoribacter dumoffii]MCW8484906.1 hypothetical protein [Fluoribacter dumoffii]
MANIKFNQTNETKTKIMNRLGQLGLQPDARMMQTLEENINHLNRLTSLFNALKKANIALDDRLHGIIASNVTIASYVVNLLGLLHEKGIDAAIIPLELLFKAAKSETTVGHGMRKLATSNSLDAGTVNLLLSYPEQSYLLADLIINFQEHAYPTEKIVEKLTKFSEKNMNTAIELLTLLLKHNLYYFECLDILLGQQEYLSKIYEGAKKLAVENIITSAYFTVIEKNPKNANVVANLILLLHNVSLIDYKKTEDLLIVSKLGVGAFHFLMHLQQSGLLNAENYKKVCDHNSILNHTEVIECLSSLPLFVTLEEEELKEMLDLINKKPSSQADRLDFIDLIQKYVLTNKPHL